MTVPVDNWGANAYMVDPDGPVIAQFMGFALEQTVAAYAARGAELPQRRYWISGTEAFDCGQVVLAVKSGALGTAGAPVQLTDCSGPRTLSFTVDVVRCAPVADSRGRPAAPAAIQAAAAEVALDLEILLYDLPDRFDVYQTGIVASVTAIGPEGGVHGAVGTYTVTL